MKINDLNQSLIETILLSYSGSDSSKIEFLRNELGIFNTIQLTLILDSVSVYALTVE